LARNLVGACWRVYWLGFESKPTTRQTERERNHKPDEYENEHCSKWNGSGGTTTPEEEIQEEESRKDKNREADRRVDEVTFPAFAL
jgi:hypothetical protein